MSREANNSCVILHESAEESVNAIVNILNMTHTRITYIIYKLILWKSKFISLQDSQEIILLYSSRSLW